MPKAILKLDFYFDHTTGQPVIPGSSIKGVLKSIFENEYDKTDESSLAAWKFIIGEIIKDGTPEKAEWESLLKDFENAEQGKKLLEKIKESIFGTQDKEGRDIFFDAVIDIEKTGKDKKFLSNDFITPHHKDPLKNPVPLMFLKVLPNIVFEFRFLLNEFAGENGFKIKAKQKEIIFQKIILTLGLGAKTNVGYGQFSHEPLKIHQNNNSKNEPDRSHRRDTHSSGSNRPHQKENLGMMAEENRKNNRKQSEAENNKADQFRVPSNCPAESTLSVGDLVNATVVGIEDKNILVMFHVAEKSRLKQPFPDKFVNYKIGQTLPLIITVMNEGKIKGIKKPKN